MVVLFYCLSSFIFDRKALAINEAIYPPGYFERQARVIANPVEIEVILNSLNSLRVQSVLSFFTRVGTNLSLCIQFTSLTPSRAPDMAPIQNLVQFVISYREPSCCNELLDPSNCDLSKQAGYAPASWEFPPVSCLPVNREIAKFSDSACFESPVVIEKENEYPTKEEVEKCNGVMYHECVRGDKNPGICSSLRMMTIACTDNPVMTEMRKRQIAANVGEKCDPKYEAWLGCALA